MLVKKTRPMTDEDRRSIPRVPWFLFNRRRTFRRDLERGEVEVLTFTVERAWAFIDV